jgi:oligoribonuclease
MLVDTHSDGFGFLAGNSIHQDRRFIRHHWPELEAKLHYRMLDVSAFKLWMQGSRGISFNKPDNNHRALEDIRGSVAELKYYLEKLQTK